MNADATRIPVATRGDDDMTVGESVAVGSAIVAGLAWLFRLEGRLSSHEQVCAVRQAGVSKSLDEIKDTAKEQNAKLDRLMEHLVAHGK